MNERLEGLEEAARIADCIAAAWEANGSEALHAKRKASMARFVAYSIRAHALQIRDNEPLNPSAGDRAMIG